MQDGVTTAGVSPRQALRDQLQMARDQYERMVAVTKAQLADLFREIAEQEIFAKFPQVESFWWTQYTPYFNDGNTCSFSVYDDPHVKPRVDDTSALLGGGEKEFAYRSPEYEAARRLVTSFNEAEMLMMFGDHAKITITRDGVTVAEYKHE